MYSIYLIEIKLCIFNYVYMYGLDHSLCVLNTGMFDLGMHTGAT